LTPEFVDGVFTSSYPSFQTSKLRSFVRDLVVLVKTGEGKALPETMLCFGKYDNKVGPTTNPFKDLLFTKHHAPFPVIHWQ
jgi:hypothetical protein